MKISDGKAPEKESIKDSKSKLKCGKGYLIGEKPGDERFRELIEKMEECPRSFVEEEAIRIFATAPNADIELRALELLSRMGTPNLYDCASCSRLRLKLWRDQEYAEKQSSPA